MRCYRSLRFASFVPASGNRSLVNAMLITLLRRSRRRVPHLVFYAFAACSQTLGLDEYQTSGSGGTNATDKRDPAAIDRDSGTAAIGAVKRSNKALDASSGDEVVAHFVSCGPSIRCNLNLGQYCCIRDLEALDTERMTQNFSCETGDAKCEAAVGCTSDLSCARDQVCCADADNKARCRSSIDCGSDLHLGCDSPRTCRKATFCCVTHQRDSVLASSACTDQCDTSQSGTNILCDDDKDCPGSMVCIVLPQMPTVGICR